MHRTFMPAAAGLAILSFACASPLLARPGEWGPPGSWERSDPFGRTGSPHRDAGAEREGKVDAVRFVAEGAAGDIGHGPIEVTAATGAEGGPANLPAYEAAVVDRLVSAGYDTQRPASEDGQIAELRIVKSTLVPEEARRKPVSGTMAVGVSNRGTMTGMGLNIDLTKPKKALLSTRLEARIRDRASGKVLWEGRADIATRDGDPDWSEQAIAHRLAQALFGGFPTDLGQTVAIHQGAS